MTPRVPDGTPDEAVDDIRAIEAFQRCAERPVFFSVSRFIFDTASDMTDLGLTAIPVAVLVPHGRLDVSVTGSTGPLRRRAPRRPARR